jgi:uncharacterized protein (DUF58 family)
MLSARGWIVLGTGIFLWIAARTVGSPTLHIVAVGFVVLPLISWVFVWRARHHLVATRKLSKTNVPVGGEIAVDVEVENRSATTTSFVLLQDFVPIQLGRPARLVLTGLPAHNSQRVRYMLPCRARGRYTIGPLSLTLADPFALTRITLKFEQRHEVVVLPEVENLDEGVASPLGAGSGRSLSRLLLPSGEDFYTMREYQIGDDLRRIHWASVARRGRLMIRQDEASRRGTAALFLDTRVAALGASGEPGFERAVSVAASLSVLLSRAGFMVRLVTGGSKGIVGGRERILEELAGVRHDHVSTLSQSLIPMRSAAGADTTFVAITAPPLANEIPLLTRAGGAFGPKLAVLIYPTDPAVLPAAAQAELEGRASVARLSLLRGGWDVIVMSPTSRLKDAWNASTPTSRSAIASST